ncbi:MAG: hypothetical protein KA138_13175 [Saprospiraceae bacterium]|nr:hypothetical protein [Saprospiraceae bacterium]
MKLIYTVLISLGTVFCAHASTLSSSSLFRDCDTILTIEGKIYLCHILQQDREEIQFSLCTDPDEKVYVIPKRRISSIAFGQVNGIDETLTKNAGSAIKSKPIVKKPSPKRPLKQKHQPTNEELASRAFWQGILSIVLTASIILIPVGFVLGVFAVSEGGKLLETTKRHSKFKKIRRRARWAIILGSLSMMLSIGFIIWLLNAFSKIDFPDFEGLSTKDWIWING